MLVIATVAVRPLARRVATVPPARSICDSSQPPKMSPCGLASAGIAIARSAGSASGGGPELSLASISHLLVRLNGVTVMVANGGSAALGIHAGERAQWRMRY